MNRVWSIVISLIVVIAAGALVFIGAARLGVFTPTEAYLRATYSLPGSTFLDVDGEAIHYADEGRGPTILLVHGSLGSLLMWNDWAKALSVRYRVIRFDRPPMGLSGPDPKNRYGVEREAEIIQRLTTQLGVGRFILVATSSGGGSALAYASRHPDRIAGLVISNILVKPHKPNPYHYPWILRRLRAIDPIFKVWRSRWEWRLVLENNMRDRSRITPALVTEWTDLNNRPATFAAARQSGALLAAFARAPQQLADITAPTLVLWSANDTELPPDPNAYDAMKLLGSRDKTLVIVPDCAHMMPLDCGVRSVALAMPFLDRIAAGGLSER